MLWGYFIKWQNQGFAALSSLLKNPAFAQRNFRWFQCIGGLNLIYTAQLIGIPGLNKILLSDLKGFSNW